MKRIVALVLVLLLVVSVFTACGGSSLEGVYKVREIDGKEPLAYFTEQAEEYEMDVETVLGFLGLDTDSLGELITIELKSGGTAVVSSKMTEEENAEGTWKQDGEKIIVTIDGEDQEFTLKDGKLIVELEGMSMTLAK